MEIPKVVTRVVLAILTTGALTASFASAIPAGPMAE